MYKIVVNPTAMQIINHHPIGVIVGIVASFIGTGVVISAMLRFSRGTPAPKRLTHVAQRARDNKALEALEHMTKKQN